MTFSLSVTAEARTIPEPTTLGLFGAALAGLAATAGGLRRRRALTGEARAS